MNTNLWNESSSRAFIDYGRYLVPDREEQIQTLAALIPAQPEPFHVLELACGEGLLAGAILERYPAAILHGYDGSPEMLRAAQARLGNSASASRRNSSAWPPMIGAIPNTRYR